MEIKKSIIFGFVGGLLFIGGGVAFLLVESIKSENIAYFLFGVGALISFLPFVINSVIETKIEREKDEMFIEFARSLVESVESGTPISKSIMNLRGKNFFGSLMPYIDKLANQIEIGIPVKDALETFAYDTKSKTIIRAVTLIREAEKTGGNIGVILESVAKSVSEIEKLKQERRSVISSIVSEGYIIFFIFIIIMIIMQVKIIPMTSGLGDLSSASGDLDIMGESTGGMMGNSAVSPIDYSKAFLALLVTQGIFAGIVIGKLSEGSIKAGIKHSFITTSMALLISTGANILLS
ncbi:MAG TPA: type II secretion system F family protein [Candidatus Paceibacterota bacterium]|nr:type II secretion system F family protein [Candidatus Paceibacterota bacterium]